MGTYIIISLEEKDELAAEKIYTILENHLFQKISYKNMIEQKSKDLSIDRRSQSVFVKGQAIQFNRYEFLLFTHLVNHPGWVFSKEELYESIWNELGDLCGSAVANVVSQLRRKLRQAGAEKEYIQTVVNSGYRFVKNGF